MLRVCCDHLLPGLWWYALDDRQVGMAQGADSATFSGMATLLFPLKLVKQHVKFCVVSEKAQSSSQVGKVAFSFNKQFHGIQCYASVMLLIVSYCVLDALHVESRHFLINRSKPGSKLMKKMTFTRPCQPILTLKRFISSSDTHEHGSLSECTPLRHSLHI